MNLIEKYGVDAYGLVQRYGGIDKCKEIIENAPPDAECYSWLSGDSGIRDKTVYLDDLRTAIASHEKCQHEWNETTSNGDAYRFFVCKHCDSTQNYVPFEADHCTDIRNHISPNTKVIER